MNKKCFVLLLSLLFFFPSCKGEDKKPSASESRNATHTTSALTTGSLAAYKGGEITETNFIAWMEANHYPENKISGILDNSRRRKGHLRRMALELFTGREAEAAKFDESEDFKILVRHAKENYLLKYFRKQLRENAKFKEDSIRARMIYFEVLDYKIEDGVKQIKLPEEEVEKKYTEKINFAKNLIKKLDEGADFAELAKEFSEDHSNRIGGDIGYIYYQMREQAFADAAFLLKKGEYTKEPVRTERGVYVIKVEDIVEVDEKNIEKVIHDQNNAKSLKTRLSFFTVIKYEYDLEKAEDADAFYKKLTDSSPETMLFKVFQKDFTIADFDRELSEPGDPGSLDKAECDIFRSQLHLKDAVLLREAFKRGINNEPEFNKAWKIIRHTALAKKYKNAVILDFSKIKITDDEIEMEQKNIKAINEKKEGLDRNVIVKILTGRKRFAKKLQYEEDILTKNEFTII
ncbi:MAG: peptidylprolyl isomerase [Deltaproteobacteria bacterium]|nr:peptidylprolyl isomerase [Deltaproteobacteria bacterium]MBW2219886.1 peptidylprolyl isomerase [Deltaproteobacteria bacterium]